MNDENYYIKPARIGAYNDDSGDYFIVSTHYNNGGTDEATFFTHEEALNYINHERADLEYDGTDDMRD